MKQVLVVEVGGDEGVAPHAGAWVETDQSVTVRVRAIVAPHAGAWVETKPRW